MRVLTRSGLQRLHHDRFDHVITDLPGSPWTRRITQALQALSSETM